jgi:hypothetical protein
VAATDGTFTGVKSPASAPVTIASSDPALSYPAAVLASHPLIYWRLGDSGAIAADASGSGNTGIYAGGASGGAPGAIPNDADTAATFDGNAAIVSSARSFNNPRVYSIELWFRTTTKKGGKLVGFGNSQLGTSSNYDRHIWMNASGQLDYGIYTGSVQIVKSAASYNDGVWHHAVATQGPAGMALYVDGVLVGTKTSAVTAQSYVGYWRLGGDNLNAWADSEDYASPAPPSYYFAGTIDEAAIYDHVLTTDEIAAHYAANLLDH